ncbi:MULTISPECIES: hypothetical protein [Paraburkholderia]|uniref:hypothetical protein n=1 Tax=Paraburkholderia TaxID=1822464 RepID=UPI002257C686|nr:MULTISPECIES: hypothetical protein [Paraburkholderia]MCX4170687.1 hypothetical protein [Paraburkholderia madseniana]MDQ6458699.1 hypothetical protein [Paraburkholderia madseniana]
MWRTSKSKTKYAYLVDGRLSDVLALIQLLALSPKTRRTEDGLISELQGNPKSASGWIDVGLEHREFFRVKPNGDKPAHVSLIARNAQEDIDPDNGDAAKPLLSPATTAKLMQLAVDLHARQVQRSEAWKVFTIPLAIAILAAIASISAAFISASWKAEQRIEVGHQSSAVKLGGKAE